MRMKRTWKARPLKWEKPIATAEQTLQRLRPLLVIIYALIEAGVEDARAWFQQRGKPIHRVVFADIVRLKVFEELETRARAAGLNCRVIYKGNVGIRAIYNGSMIAVWKADKDGKLPPCGESDQRQRFYTQAVLPHMYGSDALPPRLALLWEPSDGLLAVKLVAPRGFNSLWTAGLSHWEIAVPHPAKTLTATTDLASGAEELDDIVKHKKTADEPDDES
jgi:hypothetical protein